MATQDDKISDKRRRLFKALSAAPVVATLRPGEALATASAYQCLQTGGPLSEWKKEAWPQINAPCNGTVPCYVYEKLFYWEVRQSDKLDGVDCANGIGPRIVLMNNGSYLDFNGDDVGSYVLPQGLDTTGRPMIVLTNGTSTCTKTLVAEEGLFAFLGEGILNDTNFAGDTFPNLRYGGEIQGITGTCYTSIVGALPSKYTLSQG